MTMGNLSLEEKKEFLEKVMEEFKKEFNGIGKIKIYDEEGEETENGINIRKLIYPTGNEVIKIELNFVIYEFRGVKTNIEICVCFKNNAPQILIDEFFISELRKGIGTEILEKIKSISKMLNVILVIDSFSDSAVTFYMKNGFRGIITNWGNLFKNLIERDVFLNKIFKVIPNEGINKKVIIWGKDYTNNVHLELNWENYKKFENAPDFDNFIKFEKVIREISYLYFF